MTMPAQISTSQVRKKFRSHRCHGANGAGCFGAKVAVSDTIVIAPYPARIEALAITSFNMQTSQDSRPARIAKIDSTLIEVRRRFPAAERLRSHKSRRDRPQSAGARLQ